ncbi:hypothetical protein T07_6823 [Trichinella nelsoni]|uniref:Uncharacterized protein n=1 Tax=Trichinella nelsoni TaxID=6336 RepID=A0A0V0RDH6_9BILA|nr:hypothetical protein T07_4516 [Trichinella nelsoni]KRX12550.1 hypothetical protein T07_6823 [Trichinella nelsoni]
MVFLNYVHIWTFGVFGDAWPVMAVGADFVNVLCATWRLA